MGRQAPRVVVTWHIPKPPAQPTGDDLQEGAAAHQPISESAL